MTSAPSRRLPSSGNRLALFLLLAGLTLSTNSCELFKPVSDGNDRTSTPDRDRADDADDLDPIQSRRVYDPATGTYVYIENAPTERMDTIRYRVLPEDRNPPIVEDGSSAYVPPPTTTVPGAPNAEPIRQIGTTPEGSRLLSGYNVDMVLPFLSDRYLGDTEEVDPNSLWALHFYSGAQMALNELRGQTDYTVTVQDSRASETRVRSLSQTPEFQASHLVIGPYLKPNVSAVAEAVRGQEKVLISPYSAATGVTQANPNYVQVNPTLETHLRALMGHAFRTQRADRIVLVSGPDENQRARLAYFQDEYQLLVGEENVQPLEELVISQTEVDLQPYLSGRKTVFLVPIYDDESFIANFLRQVYQATRDDLGDNVAIYGLPQWADFSRINADYFEQTNVHISASVYIDRLNPEIRRFRKAFFDEFQTLPRDEAFVGYDVTKYFLGLAAEHGTRFQYMLEDNPADVLHTRFRFEPVATVPASAASLESAVLDRWENKYVNILRFRDYAFQRVN